MDKDTFYENMNKIFHKVIDDRVWIMDKDTFLWMHEYMNSWILNDYVIISFLL